MISMYRFFGAAAGRTGKHFITATCFAGQHRFEILFRKKILNFLWDFWGIFDGLPDTVSTSCEVLRFRSAFPLFQRPKTRKTNWNPFFKKLPIFPPQKAFPTLPKKSRFFKLLNNQNFNFTKFLRKFPQLIINFPDFSPKIQPLFPPFTIVILKMFD
jgi:hypothetical protein